MEKLEKRGRDRFPMTYPAASRTRRKRSRRFFVRFGILSIANKTESNPAFAEGRDDEGGAEPPDATNSSRSRGCVTSNGERKTEKSRTSAQRGEGGAGATGHTCTWGGEGRGGAHPRRRGPPSPVI